MIRPRLRTPLAALLALASVAAGCGDGGGKADRTQKEATTGTTATPKPPKSDKKQVTETVDAYLRAMAKGDAAEACSLMTSGGQGVISAVAPGGPTDPNVTCEGGVKNVVAAFDEQKRHKLKSAELGKVTIHGSSAKAKLKGDSGSFELEREDGVWFIADPFAGLSSLIGQSVGTGSGGQYYPIK